MTDIFQPFTDRLSQDIQAKSMAAKALPVLEANQDLLAPYCRLEPLLAALRDSTPLPLLVPAGDPAELPTNR